MRNLITSKPVFELLDATEKGLGYAVRYRVIPTAAKARGMTQLAKEAGVGRESLYKSLSPGGNPSFKTIMKISNALGFAPDFRTAEHVPAE